jgi:hypothetical protein
MKLRLVSGPLTALGLLAAGAGAIGLYACGETNPESCSDLLTCTGDGGASLTDGSPTTDGTVSGDGSSPGDGTTPDGGSDSPVTTSEGGQDTGPTCNPTQTPAQNACVIADGLAIFVSPTGNDANAGTMESPVKTLGKAITLASSLSAPRVIACAATYAEPVSLGSTNASAGLAIFGGVTCPGDAGAGWTYTGAKAVVAPTVASVIAFEAIDVAAPVSLSDFEVDAPVLGSSVAAGSSSVAAFVSNASSASFTNVKLVASDGRPGEPGAPGSAVTNWASGSLNGNNGSGEVGGAAVTCACGDTTFSQGGAGGSADDGGVPGPGLPALSTGTAGEDDLACNKAGGGGGNGVDAQTSSAKPGQGASSYGTVAASGWTPGAGGAGGNGLPGQGGGGGGDGAGAPHPTGGGGGGACGGCGGAGGQGGGGGGSSFALLVYDSTVTVTNCVFVAGNGGVGGTGGAGQQGQAGVLGGGTPATPGCLGGGGGAGSGGNGGGGGPGGISAGIALGGSNTVTVDGTAVNAGSTPANVTVGTGGGPGGGGTAGPAAATGQVNPQAGVAGAAATTVARAAPVVQL